MTNILVDLSIILIDIIGILCDIYLFRTTPFPVGRSCYLIAIGGFLVSAIASIFNIFSNNLPV